ncbi:IclR family transcriptional regulator [Solirubrobacter soli]|uniref:IclR family transcriptional regulator n=1 Tax=Solirubrobacter soli TaxID=363832 RepID=UPI000412C425|nr:IclR family transcriptional regulator C-terminal domain-containing protein [Solirubrobacter soli]
MSATEAYFASRAMQALEVLAFGPSTATRLANELQVHPRTARRLLNRMVHDGWLVRREGPRPTYTPTMRIVALAAQLAHRAPLVQYTLDVADGLHRGPGDAVHLAVPSYRSALRLVRAAPSAAAARDLTPANAIAAGKLLLAFRDPWREAVLASPLTPLTERTLIEPSILRADLERARERGYALEQEEFRVGTYALAVPVRGDDDEVVAALALSTAGGSIDGLLERAADVVAAGEEISARLQA